MVDLAETMGVTETGIAQLGLNCPHIRTLDVTDCMLLKGLGDMGFYELETLKASYTGIGYDGLATALRRCGERLRVVDLKYSQVREHEMMEMVDGCPRLMEVNQKWYCDFVKDIEDSLNSVVPKLILIFINFEDRLVVKIGFKREEAKDVVLAQWMTCLQPLLCLCFVHVYS
ncbi:hypothetical protein QJS10_CPA02g01203 [Acorus calamus]|uniref:Uncharacterized protein n=1 Tax=Acorus calamus TaxID=4465 RepID=A0AAV9FCC8_ACOCL|nr:hypothetical protein QJS10_CPA02g01203 [Acorus calamus]